MNNSIKYKRLLQQPSDPGLDPRITILENNEFRVTYFTTVSATTGTITIPTQATILLDQFMSGVDAYVSTIVNGKPTGIFPQTAGGVTVDVTSFDALGNYTLTGIPSAYPVAIIYILKIKAIYYGNLDITKILDMEETTTPNISAPSASGTDTYTVSGSPAWTVYTVDGLIYVQFTNANTGASTLNIDGLGAKTIKKSGAVDLVAGDIGAGQILPLIYDGTNFQLLGGVLGPAPVAASGGSSLVYMFSSNASSIGGAYKQAPALSVYTANALATITTNIATTPTLMGVFATNLGYPGTTIIPIGTITCNYQSQKSGASHTYYTYYEIYKRDLAGTETLLLTSSNSTSSALTTVIQNTITCTNSTNITILATDRIVIKIYGLVDAGTSNIDLLYDGTTYTRLELPLDVSNLIPYTGDTASATFTHTHTYSGAAINQAQGADIASAGTTNIGAATGNYVNITGTTTITAFDTVQAGSRRVLNFNGSLTLTYNATSMILPGLADIQTEAGDTAEFISLGSGNWICIDYLKVNNIAWGKILAGINRADKIF